MHALHQHSQQHNKTQLMPRRRGALSPVAVCVAAALIIPACVRAELYFPAELVASDAQMVADLSRFGKEGAQLPGNYQVDVYVNNKLVTNRTLRFTDAGSHAGNKNAAGRDISDIRDRTGLMACLTRQDLDEFGVNLKPFPALQSVKEDECISPGKFIPDAFTSFDFQKMRLDISVPQAAMQNRARGYIPPERWDEGINAAMLNYSFSGNTSHGHYGDSSSHYLNLNGGLNVGPWRLRDYRTWSEYDSRYYRYRKWQRVKTYAERAIVPLRSEIVLGDSTTSGDVFDSIGFRGMQMETDDSMYPDSLRGFAPVIRGVATTNASVSIKQNGYTVYQAFVSPGAFAIDDLYPVYSSGDLEVTVTEADGSKNIFTVPYSSVPVLQREGHLKYALTAGRFQSGSDSYNSPEFAQGTLIWGLPHNVTVYGGMQYSQFYLAGLLGGGLNLGLLGALSADITQADSTLADGTRHQGQSLRFLYARSLNSLGTTFQLTGYRYSTQGFHTLDETALRGMTGWRYDTDTVDAEGKPVKRPYTDYYNLYNNRRAKIQASISQRVGDVGSVYLTGVRQTYWNRAGAADSLQAGFNSSFGRVGYSLSWSYSRQGGQDGADKSLYLSLSVPLSVLLSGEGESTRNPLYSTYTVGQDANGNITHQAGLSGTAFEDNSLGWNVSQGYTRSNGNSGSLSANYRGGYGSGNAGYSYSNTYKQVSYGASGGTLLHANGLTLGQQMGDTVVLIAAPGVNGVAVENETGVRTDWRGYAIKPYASVYRENRIALDTASLDDHTDIDDAVSHVVPTRGAIVRASFKGHSGSRVLMTLINNGKPLPFGTMVSAGERMGIVGDDGLVYLSGMSNEGTVSAVWGDGEGGRCSAPWKLPEAASQSVIRISSICR
ncbi:fimbrial protein FimD (plasmid) [Pantoea agglomerans]|uniref:fimbrial biogenesis usher protein n=1 Tax=Enterobacter agglomerans TaxID=549 RepID=UPI000F5DE03F|nr:fimbrial biogenesis usher protein [Pantoea agglomerans]AZI53723.1 fimbrial protein FimD [Pantoea agglomerans]